MPAVQFGDDANSVPGGEGSYFDDNSAGSRLVVKCRRKVLGLKKRRGSALTP
jgi:hypothetical protein